MTKKQYANRVAGELAALFPDAKAELNFSNPYELLVATVLSAQCTDIRVNQVTSHLFPLAPTPEKMAELPRDLLENVIGSCGMYRQKAKNLQEAARILLRDHAGEVPRNREELEELPGVGRKTASVVLSNAFGEAAIAVDTHVLRVSFRLGLTTKTDPLGVERDLQQLFPQEIWSVMHHRLIFLGRRLCKARKPLCEDCPLRVDCPRKGVQ